MYAHIFIYAKGFTLLDVVCLLSCLEVRMKKFHPFQNSANVP